jgi:membrane-associated protease RseP (regulator of RpoE activity)
MYGSRKNLNDGVLALLVGTILLAAGPVRAQDNKTDTTTAAGSSATTTGQKPAPDQPNPVGAAAATLYRRTCLACHTGFNTIHPTRDGIIDLDLTRNGGCPFLGLNSNAFVAGFVDQADETLGATLQPVGEALRAQLNIPAGQGLLVASLRGVGPSAQAGLKQNDILLTLADKHLATAADLTNQLKSAGESPVSLKLLRSGRPMTLQVRPIYRVTLGPVEERKVEYYIGVSINPVDDALRAQLELPAGKGVVVNDVTSGSPAEKIGVKKHDIILELAGKPIDKPETLASQVQTNQDKPTTLRVLRGGKPITLAITGAVRKVEANSPQETTYRLFLGALQSPDSHASYANNYLSFGPHLQGPAPVNAEDFRQRLDQLEKELKALHRIETELRDLHKALETRNESPKPRKGTKGE